MPVMEPSVFLKNSTHHHSEVMGPTEKRAPVAFVRMLDAINFRQVRIEFGCQREFEKSSSGVEVVEWDDMSIADRPSSNDRGFS